MNANLGVELSGVPESDFPGIVLYLLFRLWHYRVEHLFWETPLRLESVIAQWPQ
jgi:hypothetical protein